MSYMCSTDVSLECLGARVAEATSTKLHAAAKEELVRAANFDRLSSAVSERALTLPEPPVLATRPAGRAVSVFDIALQLWDALRDVLGAVKARAG